MAIVIIRIISKNLFLNDNQKTRFKDLIIIQNKKFLDKRGFFKELIKEKLLKKKISLCGEFIFS